jgi:hypothetical protein
MSMVELKFKNTVQGLSGNPYGRSVFDNQVKGKINYYTDDEIIIRFPENIEEVRWSFVQGFFKEIIDAIGLSETLGKVTIKARTQDLVDEIYDKMK